MPSWSTCNGEYSEQSWMPASAKQRSHTCCPNVIVPRITRTGFESIMHKSRDMGQCVPQNTSQRTRKPALMLKTPIGDVSSFGRTVLMRFSGVSLAVALLAAAVSVVHSNDADWRGEVVSISGAVLGELYGQAAVATPAKQSLIYISGYVWRTTLYICSAYNVQFRL